MVFETESAGRMPALPHNGEGKIKIEAKAPAQKAAPTEAEQHQRRTKWLLFVERGPKSGRLKG
jgi:hypothetical protein